MYYLTLIDYVIKHSPLRPFATRAWPFYRRMQGFMPGAQPRGTHSFDPSSSAGSSAVAATQALDNINAENDGEEDEAGPTVDTPMANMPAAFTSTIASLFPSAPGPPSADTPMANTMPDFVSTISSLFPSAPGPDRDRHDTASFASEGTSRSNAMPPPFSSSISPTTHAAVNRLAFSRTTSSGTPTTSSQRKRKRDAAGDMSTPPLSSKRSSKNKTDTMNPVIITSQLNSTLTRLADVMEKSLDVTATSIDVEPSSIDSESIPSGSELRLGVPGPSTLSSSSSDSEVLDKALGIVTADKGFLSEDDLLAASLLFSNTSSDVVRIARTFIALSNTPAVQHRFLVHQLKEAGLRTGKGKGKAIVSDHDFPMMD